jgi:hypothetical protein
MKSIIDQYQKLLSQKPIFSEVIIIDFYDGATEAVCKVSNSDEWYICSMVYFNPDSRQRIFSVIKVNEDLWPAFLSEINVFKKIAPDAYGGKNDYYKKTKKVISNYYEKYTGNVILLMSDSLISFEYKIIEVSRDYLKYFDSIESVLEQDEIAKNQWISLFES